MVARKSLAVAETGIANSPLALEVPAASSAPPEANSPIRTPCTGVAPDFTVPRTMAKLGETVRTVARANLAGFATLVAVTV